MLIQDQKMKTAPDVIGFEQYFRNDDGSTSFATLPIDYRNGPMMGESLVTSLGFSMRRILTQNDGMYPR